MSQGLGRLFQAGRGQKQKIQQDDRAFLYIADDYHEFYYCSVNEHYKIAGRLQEGNAVRCLECDQAFRDPDAQTFDEHRTGLGEPLQSN